MSHGHHSHEHSEKNIATAFFLNAIFAVIELVGGLFTNSVAILSDALHDMGDAVSLAIAWLLQKRSKKGGDASYTYGYRRFSLLGSVFLSGVLLVSSIFIVSEAVRRLVSPQPVVVSGMLWLALVGIVVNGFAVLRLRHGSSHSERAVFLHLMEDVLGWIAVLVASVVMLLVDHPLTRLLDPLLSLAITAWVLRGVYKNLRDTFRILLQATPIDIAKLTADILALPGVVSLHDLHIWSQDGQTHVMTLHVVTEEGAPLDTLKSSVRSLAGDCHIDHVTVEFEFSGDECSYTTRCYIPHL